MKLAFNTPYGMRYPELVQKAATKVMAELDITREDGK